MCTDFLLTFPLCVFNHVMWCVRTCTVCVAWKPFNRQKKWSIVVDLVILLSLIETEKQRGQERNLSLKKKEVCKEWTECVHTLSLKSAGLITSKIMLENSSLDSFKPVSFADIVSLNQFLSPFNISLQSFKRLTLTASTCQLRRHFSLSVYQSISACLPFYFFSFCAGQNNPWRVLCVSHQHSQSERWILGRTDGKCINIPGI